MFAEVTYQVLLRNSIGCDPDTLITEESNLAPPPGEARSALASSRALNAAWATATCSRCLRRVSRERL